MSAPVHAEIHTRLGRHPPHGQTPPGRHPLGRYHSPPPPADGDWNAFLLGTVVTCCSVYNTSIFIILFRDNLGSVANPSVGIKMPKPVHVLGKYFTFNCTKIFNISTQTEALHMETSLGNSNIYIICVNYFGENLKIIITYQ